MQTAMRKRSLLHKTLQHSHSMSTLLMQLKAKQSLLHTTVTANSHDGCKYDVLKISQYPLPLNIISDLAAKCDELIVIEEGYPLIEEYISGLKGFGLKVHGRKNGFLPRTGELN